LIAGCLLLVGALVGACGGATSSTRPSSSLTTLDFTPLPSAAGASVAPTGTPRRSTLPASWPVGWDVSFCTAFGDVTVAHELVIDIERAIAENNPTDAQGLANDLAQTAPLASNEVGRMKDWDPSAQLKLDLTSLLDLDAQAAATYQLYFTEGARTSLHDARQLRNQASKLVTPINEELHALSDLGVSCPGTDLALETY
jgi:hypothetical protein